MSTFQELMRAVKEVCDEKDREIEFLKGRIDKLLEERSLISKRFHEGNYELLKDYL